MSMDALSQLQNSDDAAAKLMPIVEQYGKWIYAQSARIPDSPARRRDTGQELLLRAHVAAGRIEQGIQLLMDPTCLEAGRSWPSSWAVDGGAAAGVAVGRLRAGTTPER
jgi:hypothetical protein